MITKDYFTGKMIQHTVKIQPLCENIHNGILQYTEYSLFVEL